MSARVVGLMVNVNDVLDGHVALDIQCLDRIYLNGYVPTLQVGGQVVNFMTKHLGKSIPSPAILEKIGTAFRRGVTVFADTNRIPVITFKKDDRKIDVMRKHLLAQERTGQSGVAAIGVAQEYQNVFAANRREGGGIPWFSFTKADRRVTCFYFYLWDTEFGPSFIKICTYSPYPIKVWVNGHEWAKRQASQAGIGFTALSNGFESCDDPVALQAICDRLGPATIQEFFDRWMDVLPLPFTEYDRTFGYWWELSKGVRSKLLAPSSSTLPGMPGASSKHSSPTISTSAAPKPSSCSSPGTRPTPAGRTPS
jgi:hypothetical protein